MHSLETHHDVAGKSRFAVLAVLATQQRRQQSVSHSRNTGSQAYLVLKKSKQTVCSVFFVSRSPKDIAAKLVTSKVIYHIIVLVVHF